MASPNVHLSLVLQAVLLLLLVLLLLFRLCSPCPV
jgi:hypothetical protein